MHVVPSVCVCALEQPKRAAHILLTVRENYVQVRWCTGASDAGVRVCAWLALSWNIVCTGPP